MTEMEDFYGNLVNKSKILTYFDVISSTLNNTIGSEVRHAGRDELRLESGQCIYKSLVVKCWWNWHLTT
jgi:hypothetical protein